MAYRNGNRDQMMLLPPSIEEYVGKGDPVRVYDAFVEALNYNDLGIVLDPGRVGNPEYNPKAMFKLLLYGYSYGFRSSRKLERATYHNISFIWLMGGLKPDHKTIAEFRRKNKRVIAKMLKQCASLCIDFDLIEGNTLFVDGSKFRANAGIKNTWTKARCENSLKKIDMRIEAILSECEQLDKEEQGQFSLLEITEELKDQKVLKSRVRKILKELESGKKKSINSVDPECAVVKSIQGSHAGYNVQSVVDEKHGLIVNTDVVSDNTDYRQLARQTNQANDTLKKKCSIVCADAGYVSTDELKKVDDQGIEVIIPSQRQASGQGVQAFDKDNFQYEPQRDCYICPEGHVLRYSYTNRIKKSRVYRMVSGSLCKSCSHFTVCTRDKKGRKVARSLNDRVLRKLESNYEQPESQAIYKLRQQKVEHPFGHIKRNLKAGAFLIRGIAGAQAEMSLLASCFNIARMITILGVPQLIGKLSG